MAPPMKSTVRLISTAELDVLPLEPWSELYPEARFSRVRLKLVGTGFLKQMVRGIAGTLLQVGEGRRESSCVQEILNTLDRRLVGPTAPSRGLFLERVWYKDLDLFDTTQ